MKNTNTLFNININDQKFLPWFLGFCDAEGNFQTTLLPRINKEGIITSYAVKYSFHLGLQIRDKALIEFIFSKLNNVGNTYFYDKPTRQEAKLAVIQKDQLKWLIENVFSKYPLLTTHQNTRYEQLRIGILEGTNKVESPEAYKNMLLAPVIPDLNNINIEYFEIWLIGFINGEASFTSNTKKGRKTIPVFGLEHTDEAVMNLIKSYLNLGVKVTNRTRKNVRTGLNNKTIYGLSVSSKKDLENIINLIEKTDCLLGYKKIQYKNWLEEYFPNFTP